MRGSYFAAITSILRMLTDYNDCWVADSADSLRNSVVLDTTVLESEKST